jgi:hypothetical protein
MPSLGEPSGMKQRTHMSLQSLCEFGWRLARLNLGIVLAAIKDTLAVA